MAEIQMKAPLALNHQPVELRLPTRDALNIAGRPLHSPRTARRFAQLLRLFAFAEVRSCLL